MKETKCCICGELIKPKGTWCLGNNAAPLKEGRCCDECDSTKVIPFRIKKIIESKKKQKRCCGDCGKMNSVSKTLTVWRCSSCQCLNIKEAK